MNGLNFYFTYTFFGQIYFKQILCFTSQWTKCLRKDNRLLCLYCLNGVEVIIFLFVVNWYGFLANLPHGKIDEHLIQCGLADREVFDLQSNLVGLQPVEDVSHPSRSEWHVVLHHGGVLVLEIGAGEHPLHEASDCLGVTGGLGQVHLHSEPTAKPVLNVLQGAQASELTFHHDGKTAAQRLTLLHAV